MADPTPESNRFTLADYAYDDEREAGRTNAWAEHHMRYLQAGPQPPGAGSFQEHEPDRAESSSRTEEFQQGYAEEMLTPQPWISVDNSHPRLLPDIPSMPPSTSSSRPPPIKVRELPVIPPMERVSSTSSSTQHLAPAIEPISPTQPKPGPSPSATPSKPTFGSLSLSRPPPTADQIYEEWKDRERERPMLEHQESAFSGPSNDWKSITSPPTVPLGPGPTGIRGFKPKNDDQGWRAVRFFGFRRA